MQVTIPPEKCITIHINYATWNFNFSERIASRKSNISNIFHTIRNIDIGEWTTPRKSCISYICHTIRNIDIGEWTTIRKSIISNICHTIRDIDIGEWTTKTKSFISNICDTIRNIDISEWTTQPKSTIPNHLHSFPNCIFTTQALWCLKQSLPIFAVFYTKLILHSIFKILFCNLRAPYFLFLRLLHTEQSERAHRQVLFGAG